MLLFGSMWRTEFFPQYTHEPNHKWKAQEKKTAVD